MSNSGRVTPTTARAALSAALLALACARPGRSVTNTPAQSSTRPGEAPLTVAIENHNSADVVVTLVAENRSSRRLGTVGGNRTVTFNVPGSALGGSRHVVFVAHAIGGRGSYTSETVTVPAGSRAVWTLENGFTRSVVAVY